MSQDLLGPMNIKIVTDENEEDSANRPKAGTQRYASVRIVDGYIRM